MYGLAVEHFQKDQTVWNGNFGRVYFYQSETPYDVPSQAEWMDGDPERRCVIQGGPCGHRSQGLGSEITHILSDLGAAVTKANRKATLPE